MTNPPTGAAFPIPSGPQNYAEGGMTLRDWFAGQALAGMSASVDWYDKPWYRIAEEAYIAADALLSARKEPE